MSALKVAPSQYVWSHTFKYAVANVRIQSSGASLTLSMSVAFVVVVLFCFKETRGWSKVTHLKK